MGRVHVPCPQTHIGYTHAHTQTHRPHTHARDDTHRLCTYVYYTRAHRSHTACTHISSHAFLFRRMRAPQGPMHTQTTQKHTDYACTHTVTTHINQHKHTCTHCLAHAVTHVHAHTQMASCTPIEEVSRWRLAPAPPVCDVRHGRGPRNPVMNCEQPLVCDTLCSGPAASLSLPQFTVYHLWNLFPACCLLF